MIGIYGGTFDPVHFAHLRTALEVQQQLQLDAVRMIPCNVPPHRDQPVAGPADRLAMLETAVASEPKLVVDRRELEREGPSYMVDTLASLREEFPDTPMGLILGMDAFLGLESWHQWERLLELTHLFVMERPGADEPREGRLAELVAERRVSDPTELHSARAGAIAFVPVSQLDISATAIRAELIAGGNPRYLLPDGVLELIRAGKLYS